jgi:hypothetical protein
MENATGFIDFGFENKDVKDIIAVLKRGLSGIEKYGGTLDTHTDQREGFNDLVYVTSRAIEILSYIENGKKLGHEVNDAFEDIENIIAFYDQSIPEISKRIENTNDLGDVLVLYRVRSLYLKIIELLQKANKEFEKNKIDDF